SRGAPSEASMSLLISSAFAQGGSGSGGAGGSFPIIVMLGIFVVFYFLMIRPQQKRQKDLQNMISRLASGDEVVTTGGMLGRITEVGDNFITLEIAEG